MESSSPSVLPTFDQSAHIDGADAMSLDELLDQFHRARAASLDTLASWAIDDAALQRRATHPRLGEVTLSQLLSAWVAHDLSHIAQVTRVMTKQLRDAVGPWRTFLPIMDR